MSQVLQASDSPTFRHNLDFHHGPEAFLAYVDEPCTIPTKIRVLVCLESACVEWPPRPIRGNYQVTTAVNRFCAIHGRAGHTTSDIFERPKSIL